MKGIFNNTEKQKNNAPLLGQPTRAKGAGFAFSLSSVLGTALLFVAMIILGIFGLAKEGYNKTDWYVYLCYILPQVASVLITVFYLRYTKTPVKWAVKQQKCHYKYFLLAFALQFGLLSLSELNSWFISFLERFGYVAGEINLPSTDGFGFVGVFLVVAVFAPLTEEILFRGVILDGLKSGFSTLIAALVCGGVFALYHQNPVQTAYQFCCGAVYAVLAVRAGSILPTVLAHFLNNAFILIFNYVIKIRYGVNLFEQNVNLFELIPWLNKVFIPLMIVSGLCLLATLVYLLFFEKKKQEDGDKAEQKREKKAFFLCASVGIAFCAITWILGLFM
ncbi:MAG: CPBP family intramembrane metalloprotease [Clostridiales bacterium]|nr:CPBP family intramembrane metalloprotease [Clostridiales bacterium]